MLKVVIVLTFPERIFEIRHSMKLSQDKFGEMFNLSQRSIAAWESGQRSPSFSKLCEVADLLNVSVDYLLGRIDTPNGFYLDTKNDPSPNERRQAIEASAAALEGRSIVALTDEDRQWLQEYVNTAVDRALEERGPASRDPAGSPGHTAP